MVDIMKNFQLSILNKKNLMVEVNHNFYYEKTILRR